MITPAVVAKRDHHLGQAVPVAGRISGATNWRRSARNSPLRLGSSAPSTKRASASSKALLGLTQLVWTLASWVAFSMYAFEPLRGTPAWDRPRAARCRPRSGRTAARRAASGASQPPTSARSALVQLPPAAQRRLPALGHLGQHQQAGPGVLAALGVVGGGGRQPVGEAAQPLGVAAVELLDRHADARGIAAHLAQRRQREVAVERRVLHPLGGDRAGQLLEAPDEVAALVAAGRRDSPSGCSSSSSRAHEVEQRLVDDRVAPLGGCGWPPRWPRGPGRRRSRRRAGCRCGRPGSRR